MRRPVIWRSKLGPPDAAKLTCQLRRVGALGDQRQEPASAFEWERISDQADGSHHRCLDAIIGRTSCYERRNADTGTDCEACGLGGSERHRGEMVLTTSPKCATGRYCRAHSAGSARDSPTALAVPLTERIGDPCCGLEAGDHADEEISRLDVRGLCNRDGSRRDDVRDLALDASRAT